jgi:REP element-mobilizing transposase RayT
MDPNVPPLPEPLAYFLTWTTYGTWLPGDERGWIRRPGIFEEPNEKLQQYAREQLVESPLVLTLDQRRIVEETIEAHCKIRRWHLWIARARTNHVHVIVTAPGYGHDVVMDQLKAWCTRKLKAAHRDGDERIHWWTARGSKRLINDEDGLDNAILYVRDFQ